jgi:hypothetical protein
MQFFTRLKSVEAQTRTLSGSVCELPESPTNPSLVVNMAASPSLRPGNFRRGAIRPVDTLQIRPGIGIVSKDRRPLPFDKTNK